MHTTCENAQIGDKVVVKIETDVNSKMIDPYCCKILTKNEEQRLVTVGHIPREISRYSGISLRRTHHKADTSIKRTHIQGTDGFLVNISQANLHKVDNYKADIL